MSKISMFSQVAQSITIRGWFWRVKYAEKIAASASEVTDEFDSK
jgi:hypothetical protein